MKREFYVTIPNDAPQQELLSAAIEEILRSIESEGKSTFEKSSLKGRKRYDGHGSSHEDSYWGLGLHDAAKYFEQHILGQRWRNEAGFQWEFDKSDFMKLVCSGDIKKIGPQKRVNLFHQISYGHIDELEGYHPERAAWLHVLKDVLCHPDVILHDVKNPKRYVMVKNIGKHIRLLEVSDEQRKGTKKMDVVSYHPDDEDIFSQDDRYEVYWPPSKKAASKKANPVPQTLYKSLSFTLAAGRDAATPYQDMTMLCFPPSASGLHTLRGLSTTKIASTLVETIPVCPPYWTGTQDDSCTEDYTTPQPANESKESTFEKAVKRRKTSKRKRAGLSHQKVRHVKTQSQVLSEHERQSYQTDLENLAKEWEATAKLWIRNNKRYGKWAAQRHLDKLQRSFDARARVIIRRHYETQWTLGRRAAGNMLPIDADERKQLENMQRNEQQYFVNLLRDLRHQTWGMSPWRRIPMYAAASREAYWAGKVLADLSPDVYYQWQENAESEHCEDCQVMSRGGRWKGTTYAGTYSAIELSRIGVFPCSGQLTCCTHCHCELVRVPRPPIPPMITKPVYKVHLKGVTHDVFGTHGRSGRDNLRAKAQQYVWNYTGRLRKGIDTALVWIDENFVSHGK